MKGVTERRQSGSSDTISRGEMGHRGEAEQKNPQIHGQKWGDRKEIKQKSAQ